MMKRILLIAVPALALLAACTKTEVTPQQSDPQQISYLALVNRPSSKALIDGTDYPTSESFGTFAYFNAAGTTFPTHADDYIPESEVKNASSATSGIAWTTNPAYYWPKQGSLTFFSYSPYSINTSVDCDTADGIKITDWDVDVNQTVDVMVADYKTGQTKNGSNGGYTGVPTIFRHKLSQIVKFTFATKEDYCGGRTEATAQVGDKFFYINSVNINKIQYKGDYKSGNNVDGAAAVPVLGAWTPTTDTKNYTWYEDATGTLFGYDTKKADAPCQLAGGYLLILPQTFTEPADRTAAGYEKNEKNIQISYTIKTCTTAAAAGAAATFSKEEVKDVYVTLYDVQYDATATAVQNWEMNKKISYTITIGLDQIYWAPDVVVWEDKAFGYEITK